MKLSSRGINPRASGPLRLPSGAGPGGRSLPLHTLGLGSVVRGWINHRALAEALSLNEDELPILAQTIGFPGHLAA